ncbi:TRAP transporter substrate-binding protein [Paracidovorax sp. MALMAid1276]|uniref:TRAP transporter substrate-binding protein n=1 Tax=Paracidovorax sp. MALMAid1276 TaxID=3411631 RepID=UPI003B99AE9C
MMQVTRSLFLSLGFAGALLLGGPAFSQAGAEARVLKLNHTDTPSGARHQAAELFAKRVEELTRGKYRVLVFHSGQLGNDPQSIKAVAEGRLDFTASATGSFASLVPELNLTALPYLVDSYEQGWRLYDSSPWLHKQFGKMAAKGVRHVATWEAGFRSFTTRSPMTRPADAAGKKMRVFPNDMIKWIMESIGYEPVVIPVTEVYAAIQQGQVEGQENPIDTIRALRFHEVAPHIVLTQHVYSPLPFVASEALWTKLSAAERDQFSIAAREAATLSRRLVKEADERNLEAMGRAGAKVIRPDLAAFRKVMSGVYARAEKVYGADVQAILKDARSDSVAAGR